MKILAIETSCDETAAAIVEDGRRVLANVIASQIDLHAKTGGVVPEVAAREHVLKMLPVIDEAFEKSGCDWGEIDAVAVTQGPGLISSLIIGTETANAISFVKQKKLIPVNHVIGHIYSNWLEIEDEIEFPVLILTVSGGHNELILMRGHYDFEVLGETRDDAAGEAFDKVARIIGLGYPGGPAISKAALDGDSSAFDLPRAMLEKNSLDFSFSGLKTAVLNEVKKRKKIDEKFTKDMSASFQEAVIDVFVEKVLRALVKFPNVKELHIAGGVSANVRLRERLNDALNGKVKFRHPKSFSFCTDNAAMIGAAAYYMWKKKGRFEAETNVIPTASFEIG